MAYDYASLRDEVAYPLIERFGTPITVSRVSDTASFVKKYNPTLMKFYWTNPSTGEETYTEPEEVQTTYSGYAVITRYRNEEIDGTTIRQGDRRLLAIGIPQPQSGDIFTIGGEEYSYIFADSISPGNVPVVYRVQIRI